MLDFKNYFLMQESDVAVYVKKKTDYFPADTHLNVTEIGDGNLNYVFRVEDRKTGRSLIVKQAGEQLRITKDMHITTDRNRIESEILTLYNQLVPGLTPKIYNYDVTMCACIMEDLKEYRLMRFALMEFETFPNFVEDVTTFMANTLLMTSDLVLEHKKKKKMMTHFCNPELCEITEDLVLTEPYNDQKGRNLVFPPNAAFVKKELYEDQELHLAVAGLKFNFMNNSQALLHGDLHTGSIFVTQEDTRIFDPEFAFYGSIGYDIGNVIANLFFAWAHGEAADQTAFCDWVLESIKALVVRFREKFMEQYPLYVTDPMAKTPGFAKGYVEDILRDTAGYTGTELIRRVVGMAQTKDITSIEDKNMRARAERILILLGKKLILSRQQILDGEAYVRLLAEILQSSDIQMSGEEKM